MLDFDVEIVNTINEYFNNYRKGWRDGNRQF